MHYRKIGIMCGSSEYCPKKYKEIAKQTGQLLAQNGARVIYGGGSSGLMGAVANGALEAGGDVHGYIPDFMVQVEWQHSQLTQLHVVKSMPERIEKMGLASDAMLFLPGGSGTMEEFFVYLSQKRLSFHKMPLIIFNFEGYYDSLKDLLNKMEQESFHTPVHSRMVLFVNTLDELSKVLASEHDSVNYDISMASVNKK